VNDIVTTGARPLFFLDYFGTGRLDVTVAEAVVRGIANACKACGCALVGGETAELPGMYADGEYDLAGFSVGVVSRPKIVTGARVEVGDVAFGLPSSGLHSNGYSLARRALESVLYEDRPDELGGKSVGEALLEPTRLYARTVAGVLSRPDVDVRAMSHITGGGIPGNVPRVLPEGLGLEITGSWTRPGIFDLVERLGPVERAEMRRTFNLGIGFVIVVAKDTAKAAQNALTALGERPVILGHVVAVPPETAFEARVVW
jgi:phosphoribosylformylglycinamidine cyclo-ligase